MPKKYKRKPPLVWIIESQTTYTFKRITKEEAEKKNLRGYKTKAIAEQELGSNISVADSYQ